MLRLSTILDAGAGISRGQTRTYASLDDAIGNAARAAGAIVTDDIAAGGRQVSFKLTLVTDDGACAAVIEVSASVTKASASADEGDGGRFLKV